MSRTASSLGLRRAAVHILWVLMLSAAGASTAHADPQVDYMLQCRGCHGPDGAGAPGAAPSFRGQVGKFLWVPGGREYLIRVPGAAQSELDDARTAAVLNWLLQSFSAAEIPPGFAPYSAEEVARQRRSPLIDVLASRRVLLDAIAVHAAEHAAAGASR
jgi:mono/diheme cytochrome c family protein